MFGTIGPRVVMSGRRGSEVDAIVERARLLASQGSEPTNTVHLLLALMNEQGTAATILHRLNLTESQLKGWMRKVGREQSGFLDRVVDRAYAVASRADLTREGFGPGRVGALHLLYVLAREPDSVAHRCLARMGHDTDELAISAMSCLTGGGHRALGTYNAADPKGISLANAASRAWEPGPPGRPRAPGKIGSGRRETERKSTLDPPKRHRHVQPQSEGGTPRASGVKDRGPRQTSGRSGGLRKPKEPSKTDHLSRHDRSDREPTGGLGTNELLAAMTSEELARSGSLLEKLGRDLSEAARAGEIDPLIGRTREINRIIDALNRRRGNVPCLVGEPGVGKTAIVEGMALRLTRGEVRGLGGRRLVQVNVSELLAGTGVRGALSERLASLRSEVAAYKGKVVVFLDEVHSLLAATGGEAGEGAGELRAAMTGNDFPCILATTPEAYRRYIEKDSGLERRLTRIDVEEPSPEEAHDIVRGVAQRYAEFHRAAMDEPVIEAAVKLSHRYLTERRLPDKAFTVLDLAGARARRNGAREVSLEVVAEVVSELTGVPQERLAATDAERLLSLEKRLAERIVGHEDNIARIAQALRRNAAGLGGQRPVGSFLLLGPTGVGKTETARALADELFPGGGGMSRFDMSELSEAHSVARLVGAPPGYVGHESGGQLTEAVRARPYQVVLLDEVEKAHPRVLMLLLQVLEDGRLTDGRGRVVDFTKTVVIMTSNLGVGSAGRGAIGFASSEERERDGAAGATIEAARASLPPELWNRFDEVLYYSRLSQRQVRQIARLLLAQTVARLGAEREIALQIDDSVVDLLIERGGYDATLGARPMRRAVQRLVEAPLADAVLRGLGGKGQELYLTAADGRVTVTLGEASSFTASAGVVHFQG